MAAQKQKRQKQKFFTPVEANAMLPLVRAIVQDISNLAHELRERYELVARVAPEDQQADPNDPYQEEMAPVREAIEHDQQRLLECAQELNHLGIQLKDPHAGLIDFPCWMEDHEVYLCWRLGEPEVSHWHEIEAGFAGRKKLVADTANR